MNPNSQHLQVRFRSLITPLFIKILQHFITAYCIIRVESIYEVVLARDLARRGLQVERQRVVRFQYEGMEFEDGLRLDLFVDNQVIPNLT